MKIRSLPLTLIALTLLALSACMGPSTPQEVTERFWNAVLHNDAAAATKYSTLHEANKYDGFAMQWEGFQPSWGRVVIDGNRASVESEFASPAKSGMKPRQLTTHLVRRDDTWLVDYDRTGEELSGGALGSLFGKLTQLGDDLSRQFDSSANDFRREMEAMGDKLEEMSRTYGQQAQEGIERHAEELRRRLKELQDSIDRALKDEGERLSDKDRQVLQEVSADLERDQAMLASPTAEGVAESNNRLGAAQQRLVAIEGEETDKYKQQWQELGNRFEEQMRRMLGEITSTGK